MRGTEKISETHITTATNAKLVAIIHCRNEKNYKEKKTGKKSWIKNIYIITIAIKLSNNVLTKNCDTEKNKVKDVARSVHVY